MSAQTAHDIFAVMAIIALLGAVSLVAARLIPSVASVRYLDSVHRWQLHLAALVATVTTLGSLWFSESQGWLPCRFCWYQRVCMFPLAVILIVAILRKDRSVKWYVTPLAVIGILVSVWHNLLERGLVSESKECAASVPCAIPNLISFGGRDQVTLQPTGFPSITLTVMAFCAFAAILALVLLPEPLEAHEDGEPSAS